MGVAYNPSIVRSGLVCYLDAANPSSFNPAENRLTYSEQFDNVAWTKAAGSIAANAALAPDGTLTADRFTEDTATAEHVVYQSYSTSNVQLTYSVYAKAGTRTQVGLTISNFLNYDCRAYFDLSTGTNFYTSSNNADFTNISATIRSVGNGWFRISLTANKAAVNTTATPSVMPVQSNVTNFTGSSLNFYLWGAQLEVAPAVTKYTPTVGTTYTRGTTWTDLTGNGNNGTLINSPVFLADTPNGAPAASGPARFKFNGSNNYIDVPGVNYATGTYTIIAASRYDGLGNYGRMISAMSNNWLMGQWNGTDANYYANGWVSNVSAGVGGSTAWGIHAGTGNTITDWWTYYKDGYFRNANPNGSAGPNGLRFGVGSAEYSSGELAFVLVYNRVLSATEIARTTAALRGRVGI